MTYYKAKTIDIRLVDNAKTGPYYILAFSFLDQDGQTKTALKTFFINHPDQELKRKASQILWRMKQYFGDGDVPNQVLVNRDCFITINKNGKFNNVVQVYFIR